MGTQPTRTAPDLQALPLLCLPGLAGDGRIFRPLLDALGGRRRCLALDLPPGSPAEVASQLQRQLSLRGERVHVLTGSWGGLVALHLPLDRVASLALVGTLPHRRLYPPQMRQVVAVLEHMPGPLLERAYQLHQRRSLSADGVPAPLVRELAARRLPGAVLIARLQDAERLEVAPARAPTIWLSGKKDPQVRWTAHEIRRVHPGVDIGTVDGGHHPYASHPEALIQRLEPWWERREEPKTRGSR